MGQIIERLKKLKDKDRDFAFTAVETLTDKAEIQAFYREYVEWLRKNAKPYPDRPLPPPEEIASQNIGYIIYYYSVETRELWLGALDEIRHPFFGREVSVEPEVALQKGVEWGESIKAGKG